ncbi:bacteriocin immunity protein [Enterococcus faecalis]|nr:bacteriocin immunity protein [Enterococcus faecalis]
MTDRERKIGLIAKKDFEKGKYSLSVINKTSSSLQQEALKNGLSDEASAVYKTLIPIITKLSPIGLNRGNMMLNQNYLNN